MNLDKDRIGIYLVHYLDDVLFDELADSYLEKAGISDILSGVPVPLMKNKLDSMSTLRLARNMAFVIGCDPTFEYGENYRQYILRTFQKQFANGLIGDGMEGAEREDYDYACIQFRAAMQIDPDNADAYYCYGRACKDSYEKGGEEDYVGRYKAEALEAFEVATIKNPNHRDALYFLGYGYLNMGLYVKAKLTWEEFLKINTDQELKEEIQGRMAQLESPMEIEKGYNLILSQHYEEGLETLLKYNDTQFANWWPLWYYMGMAHEALGNTDEAISDFKEVLKYNPSSLDTMEQLVRLYKESGQKDMEKKYADKMAIVLKNIEDEEKDTKDTKLN